MGIHLKKDKQGKARVVNIVCKGYSCFGGRLVEFLMHWSGAWSYLIISLAFLDQKEEMYLVIFSDAQTWATFYIQDNIKIVWGRN